MSSDLADVAAVLCGLREVSAVPGETHVLLPPGTRYRSVVGVRLHEGPAAAPVVVSGISCTDPPRTLLDLAAVPGWGQR